MPGTQRAEKITGVLDSRARAEAALLRMFTRARRSGQPLLLLRWTPRSGRAAGGGGRALAAELRLGDLVWREPGAEWLVLLEGVATPSPAAAAVAARLEQALARAGAECACRRAGFP
ncbi:MAG TPA: hypothetical protein VFP94_09205, partial [Terriglobales bacterium]|nr:hypothetical protein [Terriglobales bacterium]